MASNQPGKCCTEGVRHEGQPTGKSIKIGNNIDAYIATAPENKAHKGTGIIYIPDIFGIWINSQLMADQFAANGYTTIIPDLFNGDVLPSPMPEGFDVMGWINKGGDGNSPHLPPQIDPVIVETIKYFKEQGATKIGAVGYCFGAKYVVRNYKEGIDVGYTAHPSFVEEEELAAITGPLSIAAAQIDTLFTTKQRHRSEEILIETGKPFQINLFSGVEHGFAVRGDPKDKSQRFAKEQAFFQAVQWFDHSACPFKGDYAPGASALVMAASVDGFNSHRFPPLLSPKSTPPPSTCADEQNTSASAGKLPTIPSDEDHSSEEGSHRSGSMRRVDSASSSISEPAVEDDEDLEEQEDEQVEDGLEKEKDQGEDSKDLDTAVPSGRASRSSTISNTTNPNVRRLSASEMQRLTNSPESLPVAPAPQRRSIDQDSASRLSDQREAIRQSTMRLSEHAQSPVEAFPSLQPNSVAVEARTGGSGSAGLWAPRDIHMDIQRRPSPGARTLSTPPTSRVLAGDSSSGTSSPRRYSSFNPSIRPTSLHLNLDGVGGISPVTGARSTPATAIPVQTDSSGLRPPSPIPPIIPLPPMSLPTHLQLELAAQRPSPLYIHQSHAYDIPYESNAVKFERLKNVLLLPPFLERTLNFGALACLDAWLYNFTILPMRFTLASGVLIRWWAYVMLKEVKWLVDYVWYGLGRLWKRGRTSRPNPTDDVSDEGRTRSESRPRGRSGDANGNDFKPHVNAHFKPLQPHSQPRSGAFRHRRTKSMPSNLSAFHKADLLQGAVIVCSSMALMTLDASRMYHFIRAQSAIKLYVIYNILEVGDRLLGALGQDILECLFSTETLSRNASGRSKVLLPLGMFLLALAYCCLHSIALYYQVITLNVAVNSYSNALLTLLLSNQFVEIKSTVFKRFEKDNLFQLTCADIVERFQLWIMLLIIGMRNVVEVGGLSIPGAGSESTFDESSVPLHNPSILPHSFTVLPSWLKSGEVLSPFLIVIGSEMLVDAIKHAYVTKFNNIKPAFYSRILDILCKDYYTNAFMTPSLTKRLGLAVIPLSCLFIRASIQTYHMLLSTHLPMPLPIPESTQTSLLSEESATPSSPAMIAALNRFDSLIRDSLGRATYGYPYGSPLNSRPWYSWTSDDAIAAVTMIVVFFIAFLVLLILKLLLGMLLLKYARNRYARMKRAEHQGRAPESFDTPGSRRVGGFGQVEVGEERQRWIHADRNEGLKGGKGPGKRNEKTDKTAKKDDLEKVSRYEMVAKRIW
ncbi:hypothetical protein FSARC_12803 [Fusarium sarcochroum]|uniref:Dienelactone hydrolase domain-containing protein n=1 Tax=Fusarium sarcochroum TaxID=1208366 RepID=A0A8H4T5V9_9HYPO|nr:hypothetical protein FSARC_12803 [Fusarium sarcochroum]